MGYPRGAPGSFSVEPRGHGIECVKVATRSRGSAGPDPSNAAIKSPVYTTDQG